MRLSVIASIVWVGVGLAACSSPSKPQPLPAQPTAPALPPDVGGGIGSEHGNYGGVLAGDATGPKGQHCVVFNWDRPLNKDYAIRYSSLSCDQPDKEWKTTTTYTRSVVPIGQSTLAHNEVADQ